MKYQTLAKSPVLFGRFTGLTVQEFDRLSLKLKPLWDKAETERLSRDNRQRQIGGGRKYKISSFEDKLLLILMFYKLYLTFEMLGFLFFDLDKSCISRLISRLEPVFSKRLKLPEIKRDRDKPISTVEELLELYPEMQEFISDATEQEIPRPKDKRKRKKYYSGKKKRHTVKTQLTIERGTGQIFELSSPYAGSVHDYTIFKQTRLPDKLSANSRLYLDKGYDGVKRDFPGHNIAIPKKANRWHKLSGKDRFENRKIGQKRIEVEHSILKCKRFKILHQIYRHSLKDYGLRFKNIAGLVNFKIQDTIKQLNQTANVGQLAVTVA